MANDWILTLNFPPYEQELILKVVSKLDNLAFGSGFENLFNPNAPKCIFLYADDNKAQFKTNIELIKKNLPQAPIILVMAQNSFEVLLEAYYTNIEHIIVAPLEEVDIEQAITKTSLLKNISENKEIPVKQLLKLFSAPIKISDDLNLFNYLKDYFVQFDEFKNFGLYAYKNYLELVAGSNQITSDKIENQIQELSFDTKSVGKFFVKNLNEDTMIIIPLYRDDEYSSWAVIELNSNQYNHIMNEYLLNFILGIFHYRRNKIKALNLKELSNTDEVTGLFNQRKLTNDLKQKISEHKNIQEHFGLMFIDIDHFKDVNDNHGHLVGSQILSQMGTVIKKTLRGSDLVYRYGGDEFVVLLPETKRPIVYNVAIRILNEIKNFDFDAGNEKISLSASIGICDYPSDAHTAKEIIEFADKMMYQSKASGRGKVFHLKEINDIFLRR